MIHARKYLFNPRRPIFYLYCILMPLSCCHDTQETHEAERPNVLLVVFDDLGTHLASYGDENSMKFDLTPNFDAFGRSGIRFDQAHAQVAVCGPSRASFLTGTRPDHNTVNTDHLEHWKYLPNTTPAFFEMIKEHPTLLNFLTTNEKPQKNEYPLTENLRYPENNFDSDT